MANKIVKLNALGLSRKLQPLTGSIVAGEGYSFVSVDLSSGEPTVTAQYSKDYYYNAASFGMVGKAPYYDSNNVLMIEDIYLMTMSVSPMGRAIMRALYAETFEGRTFAEQWLVDPDVIKARIKDERAFHKILCLGLGYSMGPKHMVEAAYKAGYRLSLEDAKAFYKAYWKLFKGVENLGKALQAKFKREGHLVNSFGYRLVPDKDYKALNYFIQSSVSGIMHCICAKFFTIAPYCEFVTIIHDELIFRCKTSRLDDAKAAMTAAVDSLNSELKWDVNIRTGWAPGNNFYEAK